MRSTIAALLVACAVSLFAASGDVPLSPTLEAPLPALAHAAVATSGLEYLVVYAHGEDIYWQRVAVDGTALDPLARKLEGATLAPGARHWIEVVWTGSAYLVFWNEPGNVVVGAAIDRNGIATSEFTVASGMTLRDVVRRQNETGVLTSAAGGAWRFTLLNPNGARLGSFPASSDADLRIVRLDEGWTLVAMLPEGLRITNLSGASRMVPGAGNAVEVHASPAGGALVVQGDGTLSVLRPNGTLAPVVLSRPVEPLSVFHPVLVSPSPSGWTLFYRGDGAARIATVRPDGSVALDSFLTGPFPSRDSLFYYSFVAASARDDAHLLLQPAPLGTVLGFESIAVTGTRAYLAPTYAISNAVQQSARTAYGPGLDLVAWLEAGSNGWDIRATRVKDGLPLDGEGLILGSGFPSSLEATYDGTTFAIVWSDRDGIFLRRIDLNGTILDAAAIVISSAAAQQVSLAGSGDGGLLIGWPQPEPTVAYVRSGTVRNIQAAGTPQTGRQIELGGSRDGFLIAFASPPVGCHFDPCIQDERPVMVRFVSAQGAPTGPPLPLTGSILATVGEPVSHRGEWFVPILQPDGPRVVRVTGSATSILGRVATIAGELRSAANGIEIFGDQFRGLLSADPENVWYEPLPLEDGEISDGAMAQSATLLVDTGTRLVLRPLASAAVAADIGVVHVRQTGSGAQATDTVRIEHRGGDDVPALHLEIWPSRAIVASTRPVVDGRIAGPFKAGETIELTIAGSFGAPPETLVTVLPLAREIAAADNFLLIETAEPPPPPPPSRRRLVAR